MEGLRENCSRMWPPGSSNQCTGQSRAQYGICGSSHGTAPRPTQPVATPLQVRAAMISVPGEFRGAHLPLRPGEVVSRRRQQPPAACGFWQQQ